MPDDQDPLNSLYEYLSGGYPVGSAIIVRDPVVGPAPNVKVVGFLPDEELDVLTIEFDSDGGIEIQTDGYAYISLSPPLLTEIRRMSREASRLWRKLDRYWTGDDWEGWEHLATMPKPSQEP